MKTIADKSPPAARPVTRLRWHQWLVLLPLAMLARLWMLTLRFHFPPGEEAVFREASRPQVFVIWHNRFFTAAELHRRYRSRREVCGLISASRDGAWLSAIFRLLGLRVARGSSSRKALAAVRALLSELEAGRDVALTPDGPRGPCYEFKEGAAALALQASAPVVFVAVSHTRRNSFRLRSWDGFWIPHPFARLTVRCSLLPAEELQEKAPERTEAARLLRGRLLEITDDGAGGPEAPPPRTKTPA